jgi:hypothetical protein
MDRVVKYWLPFFLNRNLENEKARQTSTLQDSKNLQGKDILYIIAVVFLSA